jgi:molybdenum cofactor cytidylyltransferase
VLAAGGSSRLGRPKQLVRAYRTTLVARAVRLAEDAAPRRVIVVLGADAVRVRAHLRRAGLAPQLVHNGAWPAGQSTSLRRGIRALPRVAHAVLVLVVDQPHVTAAAIARLIKAWQKTPGQPAASEYSGRRGVPAIFPRRMFAALESQSGDRGARKLLRGRPSMTIVPMPEAALDIDTTEDLASLVLR